MTDGAAGAGDFAPPPHAFALRLFGHIDLRGPAAADAGALNRILAQPKLVGLLARLAVPSPGRYVRRDNLVGSLWPELGQANARAALRKAVHALRAALGADVVLSRGDEELALASELFWCDAAAFAAAADASFLAQALELYAGELLPGFHLAECQEFDHWLDEQRATVRETASGAAWALAQRREQAKDLSAAGVMARRAARLASGDERALRRAMLMLERLGDRAGAVHLYEDFARRLRADIEVEPSAESVALFERIKSAAAPS